MLLDELLVHLSHVAFLMRQLLFVVLTLAFPKVVDLSLGHIIEPLKQGLIPSIVTLLLIQVCLFIVNEFAFGIAPIICWYSFTIFIWVHVVVHLAWIGSFLLSEVGIVQILLAKFSFLL